MDGRQKRAAHAAIARRMGGTSRSDVPTTPNDFGSAATNPSKRADPPAPSLSEPTSKPRRRARVLLKGEL